MAARDEAKLDDYFARCRLAGLVNRRGAWQRSVRAESNLDRAGRQEPGEPTKSRRDSRSFRWRRSCAGTFFVAV